MWVGKTKESFIKEGINKYLNLIKYFAEVEVIEIKEEKGSNRTRIMEKEAERIAHLQVPFILLEEHGKNFSSTEFADFMNKCGASVSFVIGGAYGVPDTLKDKAQAKISLSKMTFTHEMARLILLEQIYRAFTIINKRGYHH